MAKPLGDFRDALGKLETIREETWTKDTFNVELTRALTAIENARMEWNSARLKFAVLDGETVQPEAAPATPESFAQNLLRERSYAELCKMGLALTWPIALVGVVIVLVMLLHR